MDFEEELEIAVPMPSHRYEDKTDRQLESAVAGPSTLAEPTGLRRDSHVSGRSRHLARFVDIARLAAVIGLGTSLAACDASSLEEWTIEGEEIAFVELARAPTDQPVQPIALSLDQRGRAYVLDRGNRVVRVLAVGDDRHRTEIAVQLDQMRIGARALIEPTAIWAFPDGELVVGDAVNGGILGRFGASGAEISAIPLPGVPLDVVGTAERIYVLLGAADAWQATPERTVFALSRDGSLLDGYAAAPRSASTALVGLLARGHLALAPLGGFALADMYLYSRIRLFSPTDGHLHGGLLPGAQEIPVLYKAEGFAPLGRRPAVHRDASLTRASIDRLAHPCADLVWDPRSRLFWFLGGNVDRTPDGRWIRGREVY